MSNQPSDGAAKYGDFPFPLTDGPTESRFLTWLRNHSNYMAVEGFLDYLRISAVMLRGILINTLVLLPPLLLAALLLSLVYGGMLSDWDDQRTPEARTLREEKQKEIRAAPAQHESLAEGLSALNRKLRNNVETEEERRGREAYEARQERVFRERADVEVAFFITKKVNFESGWAKWMQDRLGLTPQFLLTPVALALAGVWVLLFPVVTMLTKIAGYQRSLASGSDSSVELRDRYERTFALALLLVLGVAVFELLPRVVYLYNQIRVRHYSIGLPWREYLAVGTTAMASLTAAPKVLSMLGGVWRKLAMVVIAIGGVLGPLLIIVVVSDFLVFHPIPLTHHNLRTLFLLVTVTPGVYAIGLLSAMLIGFLKRTFSHREYQRLSLMLFGMIGIHIVVLAAIAGTYFVVSWSTRHIRRSFPTSCSRPRNCAAARTRRWSPMAISPPTSS